MADAKEAATAPVVKSHRNTNAPSCCFQAILLPLPSRRLSLCLSSQSQISVVWSGEKSIFNLLKNLDIETYSIPAHSSAYHTTLTLSSMENKMFLIQSMQTHNMRLSARNKWGRRGGVLVKVTTRWHTKSERDVKAPLKKRESITPPLHMGVHSLAKQTQILKKKNRNLIHKTHSQDDVMITRKTRHRKCMTCMQLQARNDGREASEMILP